MVTSLILVNRHGSPTWCHLTVTLDGPQDCTSERSCSPYLLNTCGVPDCAGGMTHLILPPEAGPVNWVSFKVFCSGCVSPPASPFLSVCPFNKCFQVTLSRPGTFLSTRPPLAPPVFPSCFSMTVSPVKRPCKSLSLSKQAMARGRKLGYLSQLLVTAAHFSWRNHCFLVPPSSQVS